MIRIVCIDRRNLRIKYRRRAFKILTWNEHHYVVVAAETHNVCVSVHACVRVHGVHVYERACACMCACACVRVAINSRRMYCVGHLLY